MALAGTWIWKVVVRLTSVDEALTVFLV